jgi:protein-serine/threonine kinase
MLGTSVNGKHTYLGPGGSLRDTGGMNMANQAGSGVAIQQRPDALKKTHDKGLSGVAAGSVLSNSVQENFRGFTYTGESVLVSSPLHICWRWRVNVYGGQR